MAKRGLEGMNLFTENVSDAETAGRNLPKEYLSHSQIELYKKCPKAYEYKYVLGEDSTPVTAMIQGKSIHAALEANYKQKITSKKDIKVDEVLDTFSKDYDEHIVETEDKTAKEKGAIKDLSVAYLKEYQKEIAPRIQPAKVEEAIRVKLSSTLEIIGFIDLIQELKKPVDIPPEFSDKKEELLASKNLKKAIVDHKVTSRKKAQTDADTSLQLSIYSMATDIPVVRFDALLPDKGNASPGHGYNQTVSFRTKEDIDFDKGVIISIAEAISSGNFPKLGKGTWLCTKKFCPHYDKCHGKK